MCSSEVCDFSLSLSYLLGPYWKSAWSTWFHFLQLSKHFFLNNQEHDIWLSLLSIAFDMTLAVDWGWALKTNDLSISFI